LAHHIYMLLNFAYYLYFTHPCVYISYNFSMFFSNLRSILYLLNLAYCWYVTHPCVSFVFLLNLQCSQTQSWGLLEQQAVVKKVVKTVVKTTKRCFQLTTRCEIREEKKKEMEKWDEKNKEPSFQLWATHLVYNFLLLFPFFLYTKSFCTVYLAKRKNTHGLIKLQKALDPLGSMCVCVWVY
jgi:hypothetical protein